MPQVEGWLRRGCGSLALTLGWLESSRWRLGLEAQRQNWLPGEAVFGLGILLLRTDTCGLHLPAWVQRG